MLEGLLSVYLLGAVPAHLFSFFFFNDTATTEIYTLSLHDALRSPQNRVPPNGRSLLDMESATESKPLMNLFWQISSKAERVV